MAAAEASNAAWVSTTPRGSPVVPLVAMTRASPTSTGSAAAERGALTVLVHDRRRPERGQHALTLERRQAEVEGEGGIARVPHPLQSLDETWTPRDGQGHERGHGTAR